MHPALDRPDLLATPVEAALSAWTGPFDIKRRVTIAEIDPELADTAAFCSRYCVSPNETANCVIVVVRRGGETTWAAAVVLAAPVLTSTACCAVTSADGRGFCPDKHSPR